jgi:hypothetical protein
VPPLVALLKLLRKRNLLLKWLPRLLVVLLPLLEVLPLVVPRLLLKWLPRLLAVPRLLPEVLLLPRPRPLKPVVCKHKYKYKHKTLIISIKIIYIIH